MRESDRERQRQIPHANASHSGFAFLIRGVTTWASKIANENKMRPCQQSIRQKAKNGHCFIESHCSNLADNAREATS